MYPVYRVVGGVKWRQLFVCLCVCDELRETEGGREREIPCYLNLILEILAGCHSLVYVCRLKSDGIKQL